MLSLLLGLIEDLQNRGQGGGQGGFSKHVGVWVTPRCSIFFVSIPTLGPCSAPKNSSNQKIKVPTYHPSHVFSAKKISDRFEKLKFLTPDPWPPSKWAIYLGGGSSRCPIWPKFWLRGFLGQTSWLTKKKWPKSHFSKNWPLIFNSDGSCSKCSCSSTTSCTANIKQGSPVLSNMLI